MKFLWCAGCIVALIFVAPGVSQPPPVPSSERAAVERAVADYAEALYDVRPELIERSVHRDLIKRGFFRNDQGEWVEDVMTWQELHALAGKWNTDRTVTAEQSPWSVRVVDVFDQTATALLSAHWGIDHMQLARYDGRWQIVQVLWQVPPR
jgi:hypothetical protein